MWHCRARCGGRPSRWRLLSDSLSNTESEDSNCAGDKIVDEAWNANKAINRDVLDISLEFIDRQPASSRELDVHDHRTCYWSANPTHHHAVCGGDLGYFFYQRLGDFARGHVVDLPHMSHRVLARSRLKAHRPARRNQAIDPVPPTD